MASFIENWTVTTLSPRHALTANLSFPAPSPVDESRATNSSGESNGKLVLMGSVMKGASPIVEQSVRVLNRQEHRHIY